MLQVHYPPVTPFTQNNSLKIYLAGSIGQGLETNWQDIMVAFLSEKFNGMPIDIFNPRRKDWDESWSSYRNHPMLRRQVEWEMNYEEQADIALLVLMENDTTLSNIISLNSLRDKPVLIYNPESFRMYTKIEVLSRKWNLKTFYDWDDYLIAVRRFVDAQLIKIVSR